MFLPVAGATATGVVGQQTASGTNPNWDSPDGLATAEGLYSPVGVYLDRQDTLYVGDAGQQSSGAIPQAGGGGECGDVSGERAGGAGRAGVAVRRGTGRRYVHGLGDDVADDRVLNRQVVVNDDLQAPIYYMGPAQVNFQVPSNSPLGTDRIAVRTADTGELVAGGSLLVSAAAPGIFTANQTGSGQAAVVNQDGTINSSTNPAPAGSTISDLRHGTGAGESRSDRRDRGAEFTATVEHGGGADFERDDVFEQPAFDVRGDRQWFRRCEVFGTGAGVHRAVADQCGDSDRHDGGNCAGAGCN